MKKNVTLSTALNELESCVELMSDGLNSHAPEDVKHLIVLANSDNELVRASNMDPDDLLAMLRYLVKWQEEHMEEDRQAFAEGMNKRRLNS